MVYRTNPLGGSIWGQIHPDNEYYSIFSEKQDLKEEGAFGA